MGGPTAVPVLAVITAIFWYYREPPKSVPPKYEIPGTAKNHRQQYIGEIDSRFWNGLWDLYCFQYRKSINIFRRANLFLFILESNILQYREPPKSVPPYFAVPGTAAVPQKNEVPGTAKKNTAKLKYYSVCVRRAKAVPRKTLLFCFIIIVR